MVRDRSRSDSWVVRDHTWGFLATCWQRWHWTVSGMHGLARLPLTRLCCSPVNRWDVQFFWLLPLLCYTSYRRGIGERWREMKDESMRQKWYTGIDKVWNRAATRESRHGENFTQHGSVAPLICLTFCINVTEASELHAHSGISLCCIDFKQRQCRERSSVWQ